jgi:hypothetical protein
MPETKKCENSACSCIPDKGQNFCSTHCEGTKGIRASNSLTSPSGLQNGTVRNSAHT